MTLTIRRVVVGVSGGVDSAVTALLLKRRGFDIVGVFMQNWDLADETGQCTSTQDYHDAEDVCGRLRIPLFSVNFVKEYWNDVFSNLLQDYEMGFTPNPDIRCNERIKFHTFYNYARSTLKADAVATDVKLLKAVDTIKDQTFFLSRVPQSSLRRTIFPLGKYLKEEVQQIAREQNLLRVAEKRESTGICFVGRRRFQDFISEYINHRPGNFVDLDTGVIVGEHKGIHHWTVGQGCRIGGAPYPYFVFRKDLPTNDIVVHTKPLVPCTILATNDDRLIIRLRQPLRAITPGQFAVLYLGDECLGSARILYSGPSSYSQQPRRG